VTYSLAVEITANVAKYVVCRDKEEAMAAAAAGVLWLQWYWDLWTLAQGDMAEHVGKRYSGAGWPPEAFAIRVEDEDDNDG